ncbi:MAG TPA: hypothetical protein DIW43_15350 [Spongiibacteraceae bacterium]|nr:hypothetical protein [Spongiibacteraceae bacterium]HCS28833.1 hypothetical protein [Spongiibacteraceae bacterium]|tara:strand:- start:1394 stop:1600 length:207 start_codon:yes stop_codon:yes gene_type:complete
MKTQEKDLNVKGLCSRKLLDLLKNSEWQNQLQRSAIEMELKQRRHYLEQMAELSDRKRFVAPSTATRH